MDLVTIDHRRCKVQTIPGDGNCLFSAVAHQIFQHDVHTMMHKALTMTLREMVVNCIRTNVNNESFVSLIKLRVESEFPGLKRSTDLLTVQGFLRVLSCDGTWGASESLLALAKIFECDIIIYRENGFRTLVTDES